MAERLTTSLPSVVEQLETIVLPVLEQLVVFVLPAGEHLKIIVPLATERQQLLLREEEPSAEPELLQTSEQTRRHSLGPAPTSLTGPAVSRLSRVRHPVDLPPPPSPGPLVRWWRGVGPCTPPPPIIRPGSGAALTGHTCLSCQVHSGRCGSVTAVTAPSGPVHTAGRRV